MNQPRRKPGWHRLVGGVLSFQVGNGSLGLFEKTSQARGVVGALASGVTAHLGTIHGLDGKQQEARLYRCSYRLAEKLPHLWAMLLIEPPKGVVVGRLHAR